MKKIIAFILVLVIAVPMLTIACSASTTKDDIYIRIQGIDGSCQESNHKNWIQGVDFRLNYKADGTVTGITFTHLIEPATTQIIECYMKGTYLYEAQLNVCQKYAGKQFTVLDVHMNRPYISGYEVILLDDGTVAETVTFTCLGVTVTETPIEIGPDGLPVGN